jgi:carbonic anhydrase
VQGYSPTTTDPVDYSQHGKNWNSYCIGRDLQSPINIESAKNYVSENAWFQLVNYQDMYDTKLSVLNTNTVVEMKNPNITSFALNKTGNLN